MAADSTDDAGIVVEGDHTTPAAVRLKVAPTLDGEQNTVRDTLFTTGCFQINAPGFDLDSSFVAPSMRPEMGRLAKRLKAHPDDPLAVFGHADPSGKDERNKKLAGRRAISVYALLTHNTDLWERLYVTVIPDGGDDWAYRHIQLMLSTLTDGNGAPFYAGPIHGQEDAASKEAVKRFQSEHGLAADGIAGPLTRAELFSQYMDFLCTPDGETEPVRVDRERFLGKGVDPDGKADYQGCGEFNPQMVFSKEESDEFAAAGDKSERNSENAVNRRVLVLFFAPGTDVDPASWPCPRATEGPAGCKKRFFSDGDKRRNPQAERRTFDKNLDTFGCRFYHRLVFQSPCERPTTAPLDVDVLLEVPRLADGTEEAYQLKADDGSYDQEVPAGDAIEEEDGVLRLRFTLVRPGRAYSLFSLFGGEARGTIFSGVPIAAIDDNGPETQGATDRVPEDPPAPPPPAPGQSDDPFVVASPVDSKDDPAWYDPEPGPVTA
jgi:outer membrane protein OmpA-like peptidoglycan-associated protein